MPSTFLADTVAALRAADAQRPTPAEPRRCDALVAEIGPDAARAVLAYLRTLPLHAAMYADEIIQRTLESTP